MVRNKKKSPGRPKKEFVSKKPKTPIKDGPGRPRKYEQTTKVTNEIPPVVVGFVEKSVDDSKKKDMVILVLFLLSFILFIVSLYFTFMKGKKPDVVADPTAAEMTNIQTGNIDYTTMDTGIVMQETTTTGADITDTAVIPEENAVTSNINDLTSQQQIIIDFYQAVNTIDMTSIYTYTDARLEESKVFQTYYSRNRLTKFSEILVAPKIIVTNIQEKVATSNPNIKEFTYTIEYMLTKNNQKFTEERSTILIKKGDNRRIGKLLCETKGCSTMPFFNPDKYK